MHRPGLSALFVAKKYNRAAPPVAVPWRTCFKRDSFFNYPPPDLFDGIADSVRAAVRTPSGRLRANLADRTGICVFDGWRRASRNHCK